MPHRPSRECCQPQSMASTKLLTEQSNHMHFKITETTNHALKQSKIAVFDKNHDFASSISSCPAHKSKHTFNMHARALPRRRCRKHICDHQNWYSMQVVVSLKQKYIVNAWNHGWLTSFSSHAVSNSHLLKVASDEPSATQQTLITVSFHSNNNIS